MSSKERAKLYELHFPNHPPLASTDRWIYSVWIIGNARGHGNELYGQYPVGYLKRIYSIFPDAENVLHLFSGVLKKGLWKKETAVDINPLMKPDVVCDARVLSQYFKSCEFDLTVADPPYEKSDFVKYNCKSFSKHRVLKEIRKVTIAGGYLVWLDTRMPMYNKKEWLLVGTIGVIVSTNTRFRLCSIFRRVD